MPNDKWADMARSLLFETGEDPQSLREKAGMLALLNLLGIVESFYGNPAPSKIAEVDSGASGLLAALSSLSGGQSGPDSGMLTSIMGLLPVLTGMLSGKESREEPADHTEDDADEPSTGIPPRQEGSSPLGQVLGMDPKLLTLILNFIANMDFMKQRGSRESKETSTQETPQTQELPQGAEKEPTPLPRTGHKPGFGIYRGWPGKPAVQ